MIPSEMIRRRRALPAVAGFCVLAGVLQAWAETAVEDPPPPVASALIWDRTEATFSAGLDDEKVEVAYVARNSGKKTVRLTSVRSTCACVSADAASRVLEPGASVEVKVLFTFGERVGSQNLITYVTTDEEGVLPIRLRLKGTIPALVRFSERILLWDVGADPEPQSIAAEIHEDTDLVVREAVCDSEAFAVRLVPDKENPKRFELQVTPANTTAACKARIDLVTIPPLDESRRAYYRIMVYVR